MERLLYSVRSSEGTATHNLLDDARLHSGQGLP